MYARHTPVEAQLVNGTELEVESKVLSTDNNLSNPNGGDKM